MFAKSLFWFFMLLFAFSPLTPFITAYSQSDFFGKMIMLSLIALSAICWLVLAAKIRMLKSVKKTSFDFAKILEEKNKENLLGLPLEKMAANNNPFLQVFDSLKQKTLDILNKNRFFAQKEENTAQQAVYLSQADLDLVEAYTMLTLSSETKKLEKHLFVLPTIITLAPFLGLLGTVWGILVTFSEMQGGASVAHNSVVLGGLSMALATTVMGLLIAIPAVIAHNYIKSDLKNYSSDMQDFLGSLLSTLELQYRKVDV